MNPEENNNLPNGPASPGDINAENLAAALDNLTAAGRAMGDGVAMPNLTDNPAAEMTTPPTEEAPLVPAAPVPGSIGSVVSVPAEDINAGTPMLDTQEMAPPVAPTISETTVAADVNVNPDPVGAISNPMAPPAAPAAMSPLEMASQAQAVPPQNLDPNLFIPNSTPMESATVPGAGMPPVMPEVNAPINNMGNSPMNGAPGMPPVAVQAAGFTPYNPFARPGDNMMAPNQPGMQQNQPMNNQPTVSAENKKAAKTGGSMIPWLLVALFAITTIVFAVLYIMKLGEKPKVVYQPQPTESGESTATLSIMNCSRALEGDALQSVDPTAIRGYETMTANFVDDVLSTINVQTDLVYSDEAGAVLGAENLRNQRQNILNLAGIGEEPFTFEVTTEATNLKRVMETEASKLTPQNAAGLLLTVDNDSNVVMDKATVQATYEAQGYYCQAE